MNRFRLAVLGVSLAVLPVAAHAKVFELPEEKPAITVTLPDAWSPEEIEKGAQANSPDGSIFVSLEIEKAKDTQKAVLDAIVWLRKKGVKFDQSSQRRKEGEINGLPVVQLEFDGNDNDGPTSVALSIFVLSSERIGILTFWGSPKGQKKYANQLETVLKSLQPLGQLGPKAATTAPSSAPASVSQAPATATVADLETQENATAAVWERLPFSSRHAMFVNRGANAYGDYDARSSNVFEPGEKLLTYLEPLGYAWAAKGDGYRFGVSIDFEILSTDGKILTGQKGILKQELDSHYRNREFFVNSTMSMDGAPAGNYVLAYILHDLVNGRTTRVEQPFTIKGTAAETK
ncbi:hypothetical protein ACFQE0_25910 [Methylobacterium komagatae]|uniref:DUF1795 domain-containing protein n=1 Tax=Methylobacterium komagatae TaxID=374425 RepID=A0ABW2BSR6_9HYPH